MRATLVDSNVILDIVTGDPVWAEWSASADQHRSTLNHEEPTNAPPSVAVRRRKYLSPRSQ
jgi:hypothetical protein